MTEKRKVNFTRSNWLIRRRTLEHNVTQDFRIECHRIWHYGQGKYDLLKR